MSAIYSIFPKLYGRLDVPGLARLVEQAGLDTVNAVIRDGYLVTPAALADELPAFVRSAESAGLSVHFATTGYAAADLADDPAPLRVLADCGIRDFRLGYFRLPDDDDAAGALARARADVERLARACERAGVRAVYQVHHGTLISSATAAWTLVRDLPPSAVGVMLDPGNQVREGREGWAYATALLGPRLAAVGVKDAIYAMDSDASGPDKGWRIGWAPIDQGVTDFAAVARALRSVDFDGTFVFMPFYHEKDDAARTAVLAREVDYLRKIMSEATE